MQECKIFKFPTTISKAIPIKALQDNLTTLTSISLIKIMNVRFMSIIKRSYYRFKIIFIVNITGEE